MREALLLLLIIISLALGCAAGNGDSEVEGTSGPAYVGTWKGSGIDVEYVGNCDIVVSLTTTEYSVSLYAHGTTTLQMGSNRGTHTGLIESTSTTDTWNALTLTEEYMSSWGSPSAGDLDYTAFWIEGTTMHFKYDIESDHSSYGTEGDLIKQ